MFAASDDPAGPPPAWYPAPTPADVDDDRPERARRTRRRYALLGAGTLALLLVAGVAVALLGGAGPPAPVSGAAAGGTTAPPVEPGRGAARSAGTGLIIGSVVSNAGGTLVVAPDGGGPHLSVRTDAGTRLLGAGGADNDPRRPADLPPGSRVVARVTGSGDAITAVSVTSPRIRVLGTVTALTGDDATVLQGNGLTATVHLAGIDPRPAVGDLVSVTGRPDGSAVAADRLRVLPRVF